MTARPALLHEKLQAECLRVLRHAQTADLSTMERGALTWTRAELDQAKRMQSICGQVAPWDEWRTAAERVQNALDSRPSRRPHSPGLSGQ